MKISQYFLKAIKSIDEGVRIRDKIIISLRWLLGPLVLILGKDCSCLYLEDILVKSKEGIFYCRKKTSDLDIVSQFHEEELRNYFDLQKGFFVDIGAHIGKYTVMVARHLRKKGKVLAIEPEPENFKILKRNLRLNNLKNVIVLKTAIYSKRGKLKLFFPQQKYNRGGFSVEKRGRTWIEVDCDTLDNILKRLKIKDTPTLIKIDAEGAEPNALKGMTGTLRRGSKIIFESLSQESYQRSKAIISQFNYQIKKIAKEYYLAKPLTKERI